MTLTELKYIVMLAEEKHFGRAAERCHVSQPTLSVAVKKLEDELGAAIFERSKSSVYITPIGEQIVAQARRVLEQANMIKELASSGKNQLRGPLKVGAIFTIAPYLFPSMIPELKRIAEGMPLLIEEDLTENLRPKLRNGELDAIIVALPFREPDVVTRPIYEEEFVVLMPKDHPWTQLEHISTDQLTTDNLLLLGKGHCFSDQVMEACPIVGENELNEGHTIVNGSSLETIRYMVSSGLGVTVLPKSAVTHVDEQILAVRPFKSPVPKRTVALAWRASFPRPKAIESLSQSIKEACQKLNLD
ncbi:MAG: LysR family transcriptional regulator [Marinomonas sp.]|jgi:LysR family hydrogen peroxide-inducible transcriptional activator|uniref:LysR family transcriptional regulator n=1 Tax=Marinomonas communis TaxID=28254 RepID=A0A4R6X5I6_9GAMM|nr:hydrogen peroxide-inducible genes activator [Marinomonas communis]MAF17054.1 LysR family transcriptional regulator [Marinomonas sp.]MEC8081362.1 hydrogen peroxide-inducible genes activator [Pseudomonadota bacterium]MCC4274346.1 hydrogen peroxide-inducible genes activator [Marinomonas communis]MEC8483990.1 hydrogen peroxide-inducible genes activator [Pseudomonadota bacterium]TDR14216.1 LysR family transcriptional regulator [Marinomonas communis]|tara:strand:+ start:773 stop:1681 length:909 start_codon:yes stop_codon:yes gene_type:complete